MSQTPALGYWQDVERIVAAAGGGTGELAQLSAQGGDEDQAQVLRLQPALALAAQRAAIEVPERWSEALRSTMTTWLILERAVSGIADTLAQIGVRWAPIKGFDVGTRFYSPRELRETSDLDLLVDAEAFDRAREALEAAGWRGLSPGARSDRYLREEGYAWQAQGPDATLLEVHFRLWGAVPEGFGREALERSTADAVLRRGARRLDPVHAFLVAAVHAWTQERPRSLNDWRDQERIAATAAAGFVDMILDLTRRWALELPVALSATVVERLWPGGPSGEIAAGVEPGLRGAERRVLRRLARQGADAVSWSSVVLARLLAGRPSRAGWRGVWRHLWAHPAEVERVTPQDLSWPRRRLRHVWQALGRR